MTINNYSDIGKILRLAREELQISLSEASQRLHIRSHYLHALETGELSNLPGASYTKGYLQAYATFLHLDKDEITRRFEQVQHQLPERGFYFPQVFSKEKKPANWAVWGGFGIAFFAYILWVVLSKPATIPLLEIEKPPQTAEDSAIYGTAFTNFNVNCATQQITLYPACYHKQNDKIIGDYKFLNYQEIDSIMEL